MKIENIDSVQLQINEDYMYCAWCERILVHVQDGYCSKSCHDEDRAANAE